MKKLALVITALTLSSCSFSGKYVSPSQNFDWVSTIVLPVEDCKK